MSLNKRLVDLVRKSDNKKLYAEVRISPSRFSDDMSVRHSQFLFMTLKKDYIHSATI